MRPPRVRANIAAPVVIVGAGHNGLLCAARLAARGTPVTVIEQADRPGGAVASEPLTLPGFVHDTCAGFFPMTLASPAFEGIGAREGIEWVNPQVAMAHPFPDGTAIALHRSLEETVASLEAVAPGAGRGWEAVIRPLLARRAEVLRLAFTDALPPVRDALRIALALRRDTLELARRMLASSASFGREVLGNERAAAWFSGSVLHTDLTPGAAGGAAVAFGLKLLGHLVGWGFPRGGAGRLTDALLARVVELGGEVRCGKAARTVLVRHGRVVGLRLADGEELQARAAVLALSAGPAAALLPPDALPARLMRRLERWRYGLGTLKADFALSGPVPWSNAEARRAGVVHLGGDLEVLFRSRHEAGAGRVPARPALVVGQHTVHDPTRAPSAQHTLYAYAHVPHRLDITREEASERIEAHIEEYAPGFRDLVLGRSIRAPADLEGQNPSLVGGDLAGGSCELDMQLIFRPAPELWRGRTPLPGLYLAGSSVHPGPGVHGVPGATAARALLADQRPLGRARRARGGRSRRH